MLTRFTRTLANAVSRFASSEAGNVGIVYGVSSVVLLTAVGSAVDYHDANRRRTILQNAADGAILAAMGARNLNDTQRTQLATNSFMANAASGAVSGMPQPSVQVTGERGAISLTINVPTTFLKVAGISSIPVTVKSAAQSYAKKIEMALVTDITGSMNDARNGVSKINGLKLAATDLLDILLADDMPQDFARVALVPFANYVNAGSYAASVTGLAPTRPKHGGVEHLITCVTERTGPDSASAAAPGPSRWIGASAQGSGRSNYSDDGACHRSGGGDSGSAMPAVIPMTHEKSVLLAQVQSFTASGSTAGHLGTAWGWYALSPDWNDIWSLPTPLASYSDGGVQKVLVLMTDGEYNTQYSSKDSKTQALALCSAAKAMGVVIYTVGFGLEAGDHSDQTAINTLRQCASSPEHFFDAYDSDALRKAFTDIGQQVSNQNAHLVD